MTDIKAQPSEASPGEKPPTEIRPAATILLLRDAAMLEVLMVERHQDTKTHAGAMVFPGGKVHAGDHDTAWADHVLGWDDFDGFQRSLRIAAIREAFEEVGILLAVRRDGSPLGGAVYSMALRKAVDAGETPFLEVVRDLGVVLDLNSLAVFARWITPAFAANRFDTWFYVAAAPADQLAASDQRETVEAVWVAPAEALRLREAGERKIVFPTRMNLKLVGEAANAADAIMRARGRKLVTVSPERETRPEGAVVVLPPDAGYGPVVELVANLA